MPGLALAYLCPPVVPGEAPTFSGGRVFSWLSEPSLSLGQGVPEAIHGPETHSPLSQVCTLTMIECIGPQSGRTPHRVAAPALAETAAWVFGICPFV